MPQLAVVVGGGIGGLTAAIALSQAGWRVRVLERAASLEPIGTGIILAPNAVRALESLGLGDALRSSGHVLKLGGLRTTSGRWLHHAPLSTVNPEAGTAQGVSFVMSRPDLVALLVSALPDGAVELGTEVLSVTAEGEVTLESESIAADLVVGADGIRSAVRAAAFPRHPQPVFAGFTAWRLIVDEARDEAFEGWGDGRIFGVVPMNDRQTYVFLTSRTTEGEVPVGAQDLRERFAEWPADMISLLDGVTDEQLLAHEVRWLRAKLPAYHSGRIALVGDAAHAMTPNLGQGACQGIEDGVALGSLLRNEAVDVALASYSKLRVTPSQRIAARSALVARIAHARTPLVVFGRNTVVTILGKLVRS